MKTLVIAEKPSQAKSLSAALGGKTGTHEKIGNYEVIALAGHIYDLVDPDYYDDKYKKWDYKYLPFDLNDFKWQLKSRKGTTNIVSSLKSALAGTDQVVVATDFDNEGQSIARNAIQNLKFNGKVLRAHFHSEEKKAILEAFNKLEVLPDFNGDGMWKAAIGRSRGDQYSGLEITRAATLRSQDFGGSGVVNQGRLKSVIMSWFYQREKAINNFVPSSTFAPAYKANNDVLLTLKDSQLEELQKNSKEEVDISSFDDQVSISDNDISKKAVTPPKLFQLDGVAGEAGKQGLTGKQVEDVYQKMYEDGLLSYPRTEGTAITMDEFEYLLAGKDKLASVVGIDPSVLTHTEARKTFIVEGAVHRANTPTRKIPGSLEELDSKYGKGASTVYKIVATRTLAMFAEDKILEVHKLHATSNNYEFFGTYNNILQAGFSDLIKDDKEESAKKEPASSASIMVNETKKTKPKDFTLDTLLKLLGKYNVGTAATRVKTINDLIKSKFLIENKKLTLTAAGRLSGYIAGLIKIGDPEFTKESDAMLKRVEKGEISVDRFVSWIAKSSDEDVKTLMSATLDLKSLGIKPKVKADTSETVLDDGSKVVKTRNFELIQFEYKGQMYSVAKKLAGRTMTVDEIKKIIDEKTVSVDGLVSKAGKSFSALVSLKKNPKYGENNYDYDMKFK